MQSPLESVVLRAARPEDEGFLFALFSATRGSTLALAPVDEAQRGFLLRMQSTAQQRAYAAHYTEAGHSIVTVEGRAAGRIWIAESDDAIRIVDIALLPEYQGRGIGGGLYRDLLARAAASGRRVRCSVPTANPGSLRFHERLGFRATGGDGMYVQMEWGGTTQGLAVDSG